MLSSVKMKYETYMLTISSSPCAQLMMRMTPNARLRPTAMVAYTPPISKPSITDWRYMVTIMLILLLAPFQYDLSVNARG